MDKKRLYPILIIVFTNILGAGMIMPILPIFAVDQFGATFFQAALLASSFFGAQFFAAPWLGRLSDLHGRRPILMISQFGTVIAFLMFANSASLGRLIDNASVTLAFSGGLIIMFMSRILDGITGGNITTARAYISDISSHEDRTHALGLLAATFGAGFIFGPVIGGLLSQISVTAPFIAATIITTGTLLLTAYTLTESLPREDRRKKGVARQSISIRQVLSNKNLTLLLVMGFINTLAFSALPATMSLYSYEVLFSDYEEVNLVARNVGIMLTFLGIANVVSRGVLLKRLVAKIGEKSLIVVGQIGLVLALYGLPLIPHPVYATVFLMFFAFSRGISDTPLQSLISKHGTKQNQGQILGLYQATFSLALIFGPIWAGYIFDNVSPVAVFQVGALIVIPALLVSLILRYKPEWVPAS